MAILLTSTNEGKDIQPISGLNASFSNHGTVKISWKNPKSVRGKERYYPDGNGAELSLSTSTAKENGNGGVIFSNRKDANSKKYDSRYHYWSYENMFTSYTFTMQRSLYYPVTTTVVDGIMAKGGCISLSQGKYVTWKYLSISAPDKPTVTASFNAANGRVTFTIKTPAGDGVKERHDTRYVVKRRDEGSVSGGYKKETEVGVSGTNTATSFTVTYDVADYSLLSGYQWTEVTCYAWARGMSGNSAVAKASYRLSCPASVPIGSVTVDSRTQGKVNISLRANYVGLVESMKLQALYNTDIGTVAAARASNAWQDVPGATDNGDCLGFTDQVSSATPEVRKHTWYRVISTKSGISVEGTPFEANALYRDRDASSADAVKWASITPSDDGTSVELKMGWATDNYTATEVAWADNPDAWDSSEQPSSFTVDWEDSPAVGYAHSARFVIRGLEAGEPVYIRARRVTVEDGKITRKGEWCSPPAASYPVVPGVYTSDVELSAPSYVLRGKGLDVTWSYSGNLKRWTLYKVQGGSLTQLKYGTTSVGKATVTKSQLSGLDSITLRLGISNGSDTVYSDDVTVGIYTQPTVSISAAGTLTAKPLALTVTSNVDASVTARVVATRTVDPNRPDGKGLQVEGDVVWSGVLGTALQGGTYTSTENIDADFLQDGAYAIEATATDNTSGLSSETAVATFEVDYAHRATAPDAEIARSGVVKYTSHDAHQDPSEPDTIRHAFRFKIEQAIKAESVAGLTWFSRSDGAISALSEGRNARYQPDTERVKFTTDYDGTTYLDDWKSLDEIGPEEEIDGVLLTLAANDNMPASTDDREAFPDMEPWLDVGALGQDAAQLAANMQILKPDGAAQTDLCDVYRLAGGRAQLIAEGVALDAVVTDIYAPFSKDGSGLSYRLCTRTVDGDTDWRDVDYELAHDELVVDFDGGRVGMPWGVAKSDAWQKAFTQSPRWDGSMPGHWDGGTTRTASITTSVIRPLDEGDAAAIERLARFEGPCFVRLSDGSAFEANVDVSQYGGSMHSMLAPCSLTATEIDLTEDFWAEIEEGE